MSDALLGALVGGLAAFGGSWIAARYDFKKKRQELLAESQRQQRKVLDDWRDRKIERFAPFLAAYYAEEARLVEILEILRDQREGWEERIVDTVDSPARAEDLATLNKSLGWIGLLTEESAANTLARKASTTFDALISSLVAAKVAAAGGEPVEIEPLEQLLEDLRDIFTDLTELLRSEVHPTQRSLS